MGKVLEAEFRMPMCMKSTLKLKFSEVIAFLTILLIYSLLAVPFAYYFDAIPYTAVVGFAGVIVVFNVCYGSISTWRRHRGKFMPEENAHALYETVHTISDEFNVKDPRIVVFDSEIPNAYATDTLPQRPIIAFTNGLLEKLDSDELEAVIAHEMSHIKSHDIFFMQFLATFVVIFEKLYRPIESTIYDETQDAFDKVLLLPFAVIIGLNLFIIHSLVFFVSRTREYIADKESASVTSPNQMSNALETIQSNVNQSANVHKNQFVGTNAITIIPVNHFKTRLFKTHPSTESRINALKQYEDTNTQEDTQEQSHTDETEETAEETETNNQVTKPNSKDTQQTDTETNDEHSTDSYPTDLSFE